jgi:predicted Zn-dependent protease
LATLLAVLLAAHAVACRKVPVTGRRQFDVIPDSIMNPLGADAYAEMLADARLQTGTTDAELLKSIGKRIARVTKAGYAWEFKLIDDRSTVNAWCLPGGKVGVYTGILPVSRNEAGLAFILGHEIGHAVARHSGERMSQQIAVLGGLLGLNVYLQRKTELTENQRLVVLAALGLGAEVGLILPFSRKHESEADVIGMMYMARAGYPPTEALEFWSRMDRKAGGTSMPAFLSTHPSDETRRERLRDWLDRARKRYQRNRLDADTTRTLWR